MEKIIYEFDSSNASKIETTNDIFEGRTKIVESLLSEREFDSEVTILVQLYNRLDKTKECIDSILKYTKDVNFDLLLIDNGSTDDTFEYLKSIDYDKVRIMHINKNISSSYPVVHEEIKWFAKYLVVLANDMIVTPNWLSNLLTVAKSDERIGMVNPMSSNVSNGQCYDMKFTDFDDMQRQAAEFNKSNPEKWDERIRLVTLGALYKKECLYAVGWPINDLGFFHDFIDDDISFRVRRAGYKIVLAKDTWVHHNHDVFNCETKDPVEYQKSLNTGRENFRTKFFGVDAWDDVNNYIPEFVSALKTTSGKSAKILGIDVKCGTPILEIKNNIKKFGKYDTDCYAFTQNGKYFIDLQTVCGAENVFSGNINSFKENFKEESLDYIVIGENINTYTEPFKIIKKAVSLLRNKGQLFISLKNTNDIFAFLNMLGNTNVYSEKFATNYTAEAFFNKLNSMGYKVEFLGSARYTPKDVPQNFLDATTSAVSKLSLKDEQEILFRLVSDKYLFAISK
ncbi:MAG: glycosyltransferase family 2 protein [Clostridiales bacterium]|nr:glycosyltransferase family 2 protein [Clostridiales bacterium]